MTQFYISCKESRIENNRSFYGSFLLGPFENGQGLTIANALRRTLLSDLKGIAIVSIQIEGVLHEYSSLEGVKDSVLDILLNFKEIVLKKHIPATTYNQRDQIFGTSPTGSIYPQIGFLRVHGPGVVKAADLKLPSFLQVVDPEQYIATLSENGFLNIRFYISEGQNYVIKQNVSKLLKTQIVENLKIKRNSIYEQRRLFLKKMKKITNQTSDSTKTSIYLPEAQKDYANFHNSNSLNLDAVFAPVNKVNYVIENSEHKLIEKSFVFSNEINQLLNFLKVLENSPLINNVKVMNTKSKIEKTKLSYFDETKLNEILNLKKELNSLNFITTGISKEPSKQNIILEIWTNGSLHPKEALYSALKQLIQIFSSLYIIPDNILLKKKNLSIGNLSSDLNQNTQLSPLNTNSFSSIYTKLNKNTLL